MDGIVNPDLWGARRPFYPLSNYHSLCAFTPVEKQSQVSMDKFSLAYFLYTLH